MNAKLSGKSPMLKDLNYEVPVHSLRLGYTMGGVTILGFTFLALTGIILAFYYTPSVDAARMSLLKLSSAPLGMWLRSFHHWTAETVIFLMILHITRVVFTGSYRESHRLNWLFGVGLFFIMFGFLLFRTMLNWDQKGYVTYRHAMASK